MYIHRLVWVTSINIKMAHLQVLFSVEHNALCFDFSVFDVYFVTAQHNWNAFTNSHQISVPIWYIFVGNSRGNVEHYYGALALDVVAITEPSKLFLTRCIPHIESDWSSVGMEYERVHLHSQGGNISFLEFSSQVPFDESCFACASISDEDTFECGHIICHFLRLVVILCSLKTIKDKTIWHVLGLSNESSLPRTLHWHCLHFRFFEQIMFLKYWE